jgi:hypothetical protein
MNNEQIQITAPIGANEFSVSAANGDEIVRVHWNGQVTVHPQYELGAASMAFWMALDRIGRQRRPTIVCLCGSTRFSRQFREANLLETLAGNIVLSVGCDTKADLQIVEITTAVKTMLDELHLRKIALADEVLILNVGGYIGESTARELAYARTAGKLVRFLEPQGITG